ncbi:kinase-like domain-containing protein [Umbelopsis sp. PMI_123]|nr:kinase-like domain-containing protein [Umbelopsis sp. PMI_123]
MSLCKGEKFKQVALRVIKKLLPEWRDVQSIKMDRVSGALTNAVFFVTSEHGKVLLRIYGIGVDEILHRDKEISWLKLLSQMNIGPQLLGTFANGRLEQYLDSATLTQPEIRDPVISETIATRIGELHSIVDSFPPTKSERESPEVWYNVEKWYPMAIRVVTEIYKRKPESREALRAFDMMKLEYDIKELKGMLDKLNSEIVFCHNDVSHRLSIDIYTASIREAHTEMLFHKTQYGNILRMKDEDGDLVLVDYEYAGYNYAAFDIGNHWCEWTANYHAEDPALIHLDQYPNEEQQMRFTRAYIKERVLPTMLCDEELEEKAAALASEARKWSVASHLMWGLWGLVQASQSEIEFNYYKYAMQRLTAFREGLAKLQEQ